MSDPPPDAERPYQTDDEWSRAVLASRTGKAAAFVAPHRGPGCGSSTAGAVPGRSPSILPRWWPGEAIGNEAITATGLFYRRPRGSCRVSAANPRYGALSQLVSKAVVDRPWLNPPTAALFTRRSPVILGHHEFADAFDTLGTTDRRKECQVLKRTQYCISHRERRRRVMGTQVPATRIR
jgi:hypothetical protein